MTFRRRHDRVVASPGGYENDGTDYGSAAALKGPTCRRLLVDDNTHEPIRLVLGSFSGRALACRVRGLTIRSGRRSTVAAEPKREAALRRYRDQSADYVDHIRRATPMSIYKGDEDGRSYR